LPKGPKPRDSPACGTDHKKFDEWIDNNFGPFEVLETPLIASEALFRSDSGRRSSAFCKKFFGQDDI
jgi:hypothetical protein